MRDSRSKKGKLTGPGRSWPVEFLALLRLLRAALGTTQPGDEPFWPEATRASEFNDMLDRHRVGAFLYQRLPKEIGAALPEAVRQRLADSAKDTAYWALQRAADLVRLVQLLESAKIPVTSVKGPLLARELYGDLSLRHSGDLDLLIQQSDAEQADRLLRAAGFHRSQPDFELTPLQHRKYREVRHEFEYFSADGDLRLEIMWRLVNHEHFHRGTQNHTPEETMLGGRRIAVLPQDTAALYLMLHGADHGWFRLFWLLDIALLMRSGKPNWPSLLARAEAMKLERVFWQSLLLAKVMLAVPLPVALPAPPNTPVIGRLIEDAYRHMELSPDEIKTGSAHWWMACYAWRLQPSWRVRLRALRPRIVNPADWRTLPLPDRRFALYYVLWPFLWLKRRLSASP